MVILARTFTDALRAALAAYLSTGPALPQEVNVTFVLHHNGGRVTHGERVLVTATAPTTPGEEVPDPDESMSTDPPLVIARQVPGENRITVEVLHPVPLAVAYRIYEPPTAATHIARIEAPTLTRTSGVLAADGRTYTYGVRAESATGVLSAMGVANPITLGTAPDPGPTPDPGTGPTPTPGTWTPPTVMPSRSTTGVVGATGPTLESFPAGTYGQSNIVIENKVINGDLRVTGENVIVRRCSVAGQIKVVGARNVLVEHCDAHGLIFSAAKDFVARRNYATGAIGVDGCQIKANVEGTIMSERGLLEENYFGNMTVNSSSHYDGSQLSGTRDIEIRGNAYIPGNVPSAYWDRQASSIYCEDRLGGNTNINIHHNWLSSVGYRNLFLAGVNIDVDYNVFIPAGLNPPPLNSGARGVDSKVGNKWADGTPIFL